MSGVYGGGRRVLSVSEVTGRLRTWLEGLPPVWVKGEVSNLSVSPAGHVFFALKDDRAVLQAVLFRRAAQAYGGILEAGMDVVAAGSITFYQPSGRLQMVVSSVEPAGEGAMRAALVRLMRKLAAEGLFDEERKVSLPLFPRTVALVTSPSGAAVMDMIRTIHGRFPPVDILVVPARVQGEEAPFDLAGAVKRVDASGLADVIIIGRGGGSDEDLAAFNSEVVVRAVAGCRTPIVSAVGHEVDTTLCDLAADRRALTPTDAGKMVVPDLGALLDDLEERKGRLVLALRRSLESAARSLAFFETRLKAASPKEMFRERGRRLLLQGRALNSALMRLVERKKSALDARADALEARSPLRVLGRGYSITRKAGEKGPLRDPASVGPGTVLESILEKGRILSSVQEVYPGSEDGATQ